MRLTNSQSWQAAQKFFNGNYMDLPGMGFFTPEEVKEGIENEHLIFSFKNGCIYVNLGAEEDVSYRQVGKRRVTVPGLDPRKSLAWLEKIHPSPTRESVWFKKAKATTEEFEGWLEQYHTEAELERETKPPKVMTPVKEVLKQKRQPLL